MEALKHNDKILYSVLIGLSLLFMITDLICGFTGNLDLASVFSILSAGIIGIGAYKTRAFKINASVEASIGYIRKNFDHWNIILSILDVVCSIMAVFSGVIIIGVLSGIGFFGRIVALIYKFRSVSFVILGFAIIYLFKRGKKKMADENVTVTTTAENTTTTDTAIIKTTKTSLPQWVTLGVGALGMVYGILCYFYPVISLTGDAVTDLLTGLGITSVTTIVGVFTKSKNKTEEQIAKAKAKAEAKENAKKEAEIAKAKKTVEEYENAKKIIAENSTTN